MLSNNPIFTRADGLWYFWDETWTRYYGPYDSKDEAEKMCNDYARWLDDPTAR
jgi:hypothetical protein